MTNTDLIVELRRDGERALSQNLQGLLDRAATALEQSERDLAEAQNQFSYLLRSWRSGRVNIDFHRIYSEAKQKLTEQAATIEAVRVMVSSSSSPYISDGEWRRDQLSGIRSILSSTDTTERT